MFIDSSLLYSLTVYRAPTRALGAGDGRKGHSQSSGDREGVTDRTQWSVTLDCVRRWGTNMTDCGGRGTRTQCRLDDREGLSGGDPRDM